MEFEMHSKIVFVGDCRVLKVGVFNGRGYLGNLRED